MITLYDIPSKSGRPWSFNTWKTRFSLNYKGVPFQTEWVEYPDITALYEKLNIPPTDFYPDGRPYHSLPVIKDDSTGAVVAESFKIAKYLDKTYPDTPKLIPDIEGGGLEKQKEFAQGSFRHIYSAALLIFKNTLPILNPRSRDYYTVARAQDLPPSYTQSSLDDIHITDEEAREMWGQFQAALNTLSHLFGGEEKFSWYNGDTISFADFVVGAILEGIREAWGEDSDGWKEVMTWNKGKWKEFVHRLKKYETAA